MSRSLNDLIKRNIKPLTLEEVLSPKPAAKAAPRGLPWDPVPAEKANEPLAANLKGLGIKQAPAPSKPIVKTNNSSISGGVFGKNMTDNESVEKAAAKKELTKKLKAEVNKPATIAKIQTVIAKGKSPQVTATAISKIVTTAMKKAETPKPVVRVVKKESDIAALIAEIDAIPAKARNAKNTVQSATNISKEITKVKKDAAAGKDVSSQLTKLEGDVNVIQKNVTKAHAVQKKHNEKINKDTKAIATTITKSPSTIVKKALSEKAKATTLKAGIKAKGVVLDTKNNGKVLKVEKIAKVPAVVAKQLKSGVVTTDAIRKLADKEPTAKGKKEIKDFAAKVDAKMKPASAKKATKKA